MIKIGDIGKILTGNTPKTSETENYNSDDICFVKPSDIPENNISYINDSEFYISETARSKARILPTQSVLVTCIGIIGKVAINQVECAFNQQINAIIPDLKKCLPNYLAYAIQYRKEQMQDIANAAVVPILNKTQFSNIEINLPSLDKQHETITVLCKIGKLISLRKQQLTKLDELVTARFVEMFGESRSNLKGWQTVALQEIANVGSSKRVFVEELKKTGIPFFRGTEIGALAEGKRVVPELFITQEHYQSLCEATGAPAMGDLLMPSICPDGRIWLVDNESPFYFKDGRVLWVHPVNKKINGCYLQHALKETIMADYESIASGTTFAELKIFALKALQIMVPPLKLQELFSNFVANVERQRLTIQQSLDKLEVLKKTLMQEYFG